MRFFLLLSSLALLAGIIDVPGVVAKSAVRQYKSVPRQQALLKNVKTEKKKAKTDLLVSQPVSQGQKDAITGAVIMTLIERGINKIFVANGVKFPSQLGGCIALFFFLLLADVVSPGLGESIFTSLTPGSALLGKWLPVFFVPGLAMLPLAPSVGSGVEVCHATNKRQLYQKHPLTLTTLCIGCQGPFGNMPRLCLLAFYCSIFCFVPEGRPGYSYQECSSERRQRLDLNCGIQTIF
jgi:hypothetical protein